MPEDSMVIGQGGADVNFPGGTGADWGMRPGIDAIEGPPGYDTLLAEVERLRNRQAALAATLKKTLEPLHELKAFLVDRLAYDEAAGIADIIGAAEHPLHDPTSEP